MRFLTEEGFAFFGKFDRQKALLIIRNVGLI